VKNIGKSKSVEIESNICRMKRQRNYSKIAGGDQEKDDKDRAEEQEGGGKR